ncbi:hypothetical protein ACFL2B_01995 [Patescibacteria group bacterium]
MNKYTILTIGVIVVVLVAWLLLALVMKQQAGKATPATVQTAPALQTTQPNATTGPQDVEMKVDVPNNNVEQSVTVPY